VLNDLERALVAALHADDALGALRGEARLLAPADRSSLEGAGGDGVLLTSLLVKKLRFEAVIRGDRNLEIEFERDPAAFTEEFRAFAREVPPREYFPSEAAASFRAWRSRRAEPK